MRYQKITANSKSGHSAESNSKMKRFHWRGPLRETITTTENSFEYSI